MKKKKKKMKKWKRVKGSKIHLQGHVVFHMVFGFKGTKEAPKHYNGERIQSDPDFTPFAKIIDLNVKAKTIRTSKNKKRISL